MRGARIRSGGCPSVIAGFREVATAAMAIR
jgi:hypothetical protein